METRRDFIKKVATVLGMVAIGKEAQSMPVQAKPMTLEAKSKVYRAINGRPGENLSKVIELTGGIERVIGSDDIVVIKPNLQWWNQGAPNLLAIKTLVEMIMDRPGGFRGEVVIAENCHRGPEPWKSRSSGWAHHFERNSDNPGSNNFNQLCSSLKEAYGKKLTVCHWINVAAGNRRVFGPSDGDGYVYCDGTGGVPLLSIDNGLHGEAHRSVIMSYPVFKTERGTLIDFKVGVWEKGTYTGQPLKFVNLAALNHHSTYCGATSAVKNYLGISDLSGGPDPHSGGKLTKEHYNFHSFPFNKWAPGPAPGMLGSEIGVFMKTIRKADLNITTADWVGLSSRIDPPVARTRAVLASVDPVALDYHSAKYLLYPNSSLKIHDPVGRKSPVHDYLLKCAENGGGVLDERYVKVESFDFLARKLQRDEDLVVHAEKHWGTNPKAILKYLYLRYMG